jgi:hypothetical protein
MKFISVGDSFDGPQVGILSQVGKGVRTKEGNAKGRGWRVVVQTGIGAEEQCSAEVQSVLQNLPAPPWFCHRTHGGCQLKS